MLCNLQNMFVLLVGPRGQLTRIDQVVWMTRLQDDGLSNPHCVQSSVTRIDKQQIWCHGYMSIDEEAYVVVDWHWPSDVDAENEDKWLIVKSNMQKLMIIEVVVNIFRVGWQRMKDALMANLLQSIDGIKMINRVDQICWTYQVC